MGQQAKYNVENFYSVVGLTSHMKSTMALFEAYLPKFFTGLTQFYEETEADPHNFKMVNPNYDKNVSNAVLKLLMLNPLMQVDMDVYYFVEKRFQTQYYNLIVNNS